MLHKNALRSITSTSSEKTNLRVMPPRSASTSLFELAVITSRRCSAFFAEAAVLVLVFGILDYFMLKGRIELAWILLAIGASLTLLAASIATDFAAHHWVKAHP